MEPAVIVSIVLAVISLVSVYMTVRQYRRSNADRDDTQLKATIRQVHVSANEPLLATISDHTMRMAQQGDRLNRIEELLKDTSTDLRRLTDELSKMGVKVDMYWSTLESLAMNAAKGLHQPDPARARIDYLLEAFMEETLTPDERIELKKVLVLIRNYEPDRSTLDFPVTPGEQTFAAILLSTMDLVKPGSITAMGHNVHRKEK